MFILRTQRDTAGLSGIQTRHTFRSSEGQLTSDEVLGHLITFYNMLKHCWNAQALLTCASNAKICKHYWNVQASQKCSIIAEICNHCWNVQSLLKRAIIADIRKQCWHPQAMLARLYFEISASVLNWTFIKAARPKVLKNVFVFEIASAGDTQNVLPKQF